MSTPLVEIVRNIETVDATLGSVLIDAVKQCLSLEHLWADNARNISRFPPGEYPLRWIYSAHHERNLWHIMDVPGRDAIEIHSGNTVADTKGCPVLGGTRWDNRNTTYVLGSRVALASFESKLFSFQGSGCTIRVTDQFQTVNPTSTIQGE